MEYGVQIRPMGLAQVDALATPGSGSGSEVIWHQAFDTQTYTSATTVILTFFAAVNNDRTLSNMDDAGRFGRGESLQVHNVCLDILPTTPVTTAAAGSGINGILRDMALLTIGAAARPTWTFQKSRKDYGPYSLTTLRGTGGPTGFGWGSVLAAGESIQTGKNDPAGGWNYKGSIIIPEQIGFGFRIDYAAAVTLTSGNPLFRVSLFGILNRRIA